MKRASRRSPNGNSPQPPAAPRNERSSIDASVVKSAGRAFRILELFDQTQKEMSLTDISTQLGFPPSSTSALLKSLMALGYLTFDQNERIYMPTTRVALLGSWVFGRLFGEARILQMMQYLHERTSETIILGMQNDVFAQYIHVIQAKHHIRYHVAPGTLRALCRSAIGWMLLSAQGDADIAKVVRRINAETDRRADRIELRDLMERIVQARSKAYAYSRHSVNEGVGAIAMLLPRPVGGRQLAIGVAGPVERLDASESAIVRHMTSAIGRFVLT